MTNFATTVYRIKIQLTSENGRANRKKYTDFIIFGNTMKGGERKKKEREGFVCVGYER